MNKRFSVILVVLSFVCTSSALADYRRMGSLGALEAAPYAMEREQEIEANREAIRDTYKAGFEQGREMVDQGLDMFDSLSDLLNSSTTLSDIDTEFDPDYNPEDMPEVPVSCNLGDERACQQCYQDAYRKLNFVRFYLERLRAIYGATTTYAGNAIAFGDSMSGIHGGFGMAWPPERKGIQEQVNKFKVTCRKKYEDYMKSLKKALKAIDECEQKHFDNTDWYNRYGFIYFTYMRDRYRL